MPSLHLAYRGLNIRVHGPDDAHFAWLEEFLAPAFGRADGAAADCDVVVEEDADALARLRMRAHGAVAPATCLVLDSQPVQLPSWREAVEQVVFHEEARVAYRISGDRRRITVVTAPKNAALRTVLMKLVRELAMSAAWSPRGLILHAAACVVDGRAVLIAGPRRAGKTSLLLHALRAEGVRLLSNDRVVLELDADAAVAHGMPTIVSLRADTVVRQFPSPSALAAALRYRFALTVQEAEGREPATDLTPRGLACSPAQLGRLFGNALVGRAAATALVLPRVDPGAQGIALSPLDADAAATRHGDVLFAAHAAPQVSDCFALREHARAPSAAEVRARWRDAVERLRVFECRLGPDAYATDPGTQLLAPLLDI